MTPDAGGSILVVIDEVTEGNWGAAGRTISLNAIAGNGRASQGRRAVCLGAGLFRREEAAVRSRRLSG